MRLFQTLLILCVLGLTNVSGQKLLKIDSLKQQLKRTDIADSVRLDLYILLISSYYLKADDDKMQYYQKKAVALAKNKNYPARLATTHLLNANRKMDLGKNNEAEHLVKLCLSFAQKAKDNELIATSYLLLGKLFYVKNNYPKALDMLQKSIEVKKGRFNDNVSYAYVLMGNILNKQGNYTKALKVLQKGLQLAEDIKNGTSYFSLSTLIGAIQEEQNNYAKAIELYKKALIYYQKEEIFFFRGTIYNRLGFVYQKIGDQPKALEMHQQGLLFSRRNKEQQAIVVALANIGKIYLQQNKIKIAYKYLKEALDIGTKYKLKDGLADTHLVLGQTFFSQKEYKKALHHLEKSLELAQRNGSLPRVRDAAEQLTKVFKATGKYQQALRSHELFKKIADSLFNESNTKKITQLEDQYRFNKEKDSIRTVEASKRKVLDAQIKSQAANQRATFLGLSLTVLLLLVLGIFYRSKQRSNYRLMESNKQLNEQKSKVSAQNKMLQRQQEEIISQQEFVEQKNKELSQANLMVSQSIRSAQTIQKAILPQQDKFHHLFSDHFIINRPRDVVSGDFYWLHKTIDKTILVVADCTGHGVPGAFMTLIGNNLLDKIIIQQQIDDPAEILTRLHIEVLEVLKQKETNNNNGMDAVIITLKNHQEAIELDFAGAKNNLLVWKDAKLLKLDGTLKAIGGYQPKKLTFENQHISLNRGDLIFLGSDGLEDQNNEQRRKFGRQRIESLIKETCLLPLQDQKQKFETALEEFMKGVSQRDDILWIGVKV
ncbi:hypothetical protein BKI52_28750 [marine bacterium AO1-C]|nr:hypothetical protein BKI52_28750 [marine bacterium AO1-C]